MTSLHQQLKTETSSEKAKIKAQAFRGIEAKGKYTSAEHGVKIEIVGDIASIEVNGQHGIEVFARAWRGNKQLGFGKDGSVDIERFRIFNPPILVADESGDIAREATNPDTEEVTIKYFREDLIQAVRESIAHTANLAGKSETEIEKGKIGNTTSTFYPAAGTNSPVDGNVNQTYSVGSGIDWADLVGDTGSGANPTATTANNFVRADTTTDKWRELWRGAYLFDTSSLSGQVVDSATLSLYGQTKDSDTFGLALGITEINPASDSNLVAGDYDSVSNTRLASDIAWASLSASAYNDFTLNASGEANINTTGISKFSSRLDVDIDDSAPTWSSGATQNFVNWTADQSGTANDPKLVVEHSAAPGTGIAYDTAGENYTASSASTSFSLAAGAGSGRVAILNAWTGGGDRLTGITVDGNAATFVQKLNYSGSQWLYTYYYVDPPTSSVTYQADASDASDDIELHALLYNGCDTVSVPDSSNTDTSSSSTSLTISTTTVADNSWLVGHARGTAGKPSAGTGTTARTTGVAMLSGDSDGAKSPAGSYSMGWSWVSSSDNGACIVSLDPAAGADATTPVSNLSLLGVG